MTKTPEQIAYDKLQLRLIRRFRQASKQYGLLEDGDHILVAISGGKDSLMLTELLGKQSQIFKPSIRVTAVHISVENIGYQVDLEYLRSFCSAVNMPFVHKVTHYEELPPEHRNKNHCFLCSWYRRKALFDAAKELGCNKIALGHHRDDILQTLLMNMLFGGNISTMPPKLQMDKMPLQIIRPLCLIDEKDIAQYAALTGYQKQVKTCPFEYESTRAEAKEILETLSRRYRDAKDSLWAAMENIKTNYLPQSI